MADKVYLKLVSVNGLVFEQHADMAVLPGHDGDMGILAHHAALIAYLNIGLVRLYNNNILTQQIFITDGFVQVNDDGCIVLVNEWVPIEQLNQQLLQTQLEGKMQAIKATNNVIEQQVIRDHITLINAKLNVIGHTFNQ